MPTEHRVASRDSQNAPAHGYCPARTLAFAKSERLPMFGAEFRSVGQCPAQKILAILCRANSTNITKDLRKVLLGFETTRDGYVQYS